MAEENKKPTEIKAEKIEEKKAEAKPAESKETKEIKKAEKPVKKKRTEVSIKGLNLRISFKVGADICSMIRYRNIDAAIKMVEEVIAKRRPVRMNKREKPHQHGHRVFSAAYPVDAAKDFLRMLKQLRADAVYSEIELEKSVISECKCDKASRPYKRGGARGKRAHVFIRLSQKKAGERERGVKK